MTDIVALIEQHADRGDVPALIQACNTLGGLGSILFGVPMRESYKMPAIIAAAHRALERTIEHLPLEQTESVLDALGRASFTIDTSALHARVAAAAEPAARAITAWLARVTDVAALIDACEALDSGGVVGATYFARSWPGRRTLRDAAVHRLRETIAALPPAAARDAIIAVRDADLEIDLGAVTAVLSHVTSDEPINADIEAAITADPDDAANYAVLGDWLSERGHVRGPLIALHLRAEADQGIAPTAADYADEHAAELVGVLANLDLAPTWRRGFIDAVTLVDHHTIHLDEQVAALFAHPSSRRLRSLELGSTDTLQAGIDAIATCAPRQLRELVLGDTRLGHTRAIELSALFDKLPDLRALLVRGSFSATPIHHATLERARFETVALSQPELACIATADWPQLRHLDVWFGDPNSLDDEDLVPNLGDAIAVLAREDLVDLRHLGLMNAMITDELCEAIATSPLANQLVELDLSLGSMTTAGATALLASGLPRVEHLNVSSNYLGEGSIAQLRSRFRTVIADHQRTDHGDRYPAISE